MKSYFVVGLCIAVLFAVAMSFSGKAFTSTENPAAAEMFSTKCPEFESDTGTFLSVTMASTPSAVHLAYVRTDGKTKCTVTVANERGVHFYRVGQPLEIHREFERGDLRTFVVPVGASIGDSPQAPPDRTY